MDNSINTAVADQLNTVKFIKDVESHPCLYDYRLPEYTRRDITETAWQEIGRNNNMTAAQCKEKWKNIRTVFTRHLNPSYSKRKKPYYLSDVMQFAVPFIKTAHNNMAISPKIHQTGSLTCENEEENSREIEEYEEGEVKTEPDSFYAPCLSPDLMPNEMLSRSNSPPSKKRKASIEVVEDEYFEPMTMNKSQNNNKKSESFNMNSRKMFLLSLLPDVYAMTDVQMRKFKIKLLTLVDDMLQE